MTPTPTTPVTVRTDCGHEELSWLVAEHVTKWRRVVYPVPPEFKHLHYHEPLTVFKRPDGIQQVVPDYSTSLNDIWPLVAGRSWNSWSQGEKDDLRAYFAIYPEKKDPKTGKPEQGYNPSWGTTLPRAVCFALLRQAGVTVEDAPSPLS